MPNALTCPWCGAPLPNVTAGQALATCAYCGCTASLQGVRATKAGPAKTTAAPIFRTASVELQQHVIETFKKARQGGSSPFEALLAASRARLGPLGETDAFARVCLALATDFDEENGTSVVEDATCMGRLIETYLTAIEAVRTRGSYDVNMPFFTASASGPKHFARTLTADAIADLAAKVPAPPKTPEKKGRFWPFG